MAKANGRGISWQLIGIAAVLAVLVIGGLITLLDSGDSDIESPIVITKEESLGIGECTDPEGRPCLGDDDAPVTLYEFADFQCPHCADHSQLYAKSIKRDYIATGKAKLVWVNFSFLGDESKAAAAAGLCAQDQGYFWELHDWMFENQATLANTGGFSRARLEQMAVSAGVDGDAFKACLEDDSIAQQVEADTAFARESGVESTPSFVIGDTKVEGSGVDAVKAIGSAIEAAISG